MFTHFARFTCLGLIFSLLFSLNLSSQSRNYLAKGPEGTQTFQLDLTRILVSFKTGITESKRTAMVRKFPDLAAYNAQLDVPQLQATTLEVKPGVTAAQVENLLEALNKCPELSYAAPFLLFGKDAHEGILNQINVGLNGQEDLNWLKSTCRKLDLLQPVPNEFDPLVFHISVPDNRMGKAFDVANQLYETGIPAFAEVNFLRIIAPYTNDPINIAQWAQENSGKYWDGNNWINVGLVDADMDVQGAWQITTGSSSIKVAVIDDGVDIDHPDLIGNMLPGFDATGFGSAGNASGNDAHGTACAGIIAAKGNNGIGLAGNAYNCKIIPIRIAYTAAGQSQWTFTAAWAANGINWAWQTGAADVLSNSWGGGSSSSTINTAILNAVTNGRNGKGAPVLFATGNDNANGVSNPASNANVIAVGATSMCDKRKSFASCDGESWWGSNYGTGLDIVAPGVKIATTDVAGAAGSNSGDYNYTFNGTSSATPNAASVVALILSVNSNLMAAQARAILESTCQKVGGYSYSTNSSQPNGTWNNEMGYGRVNAQAACAAAQNANSCNAPSTSQLSATNITGTAARLNCSVSGMSAYDFRYRKIGVNSWTDLPGGTNNYIDITGLLANTQYEFSAAVKCNSNTWSIWSANKPFTTQIATPLNDNVCSPTPITAGSSCTYTSGNTTGATASSSGTTCGATAPKDIWFKCSIPSSGKVTFRTSAGTLTDAVMAVYWGSSCSSLTYITCEDNNSNGNGSSMPVIGITGQAGTQLWVRIWGKDNASGTLGICALNYSTANFGPGGEEGTFTEFVSIPTVQDRAQSAIEQFDVEAGSSITVVASERENLDRFDGLENAGIAQIGLISPNPTTDQAFIPYTLVAKSKVQIVTSDLLGRVLQVLALEQEAGVFQADINLDGLPTGMYLVRMCAGDQVRVQQLQVIR